MGQFSCHWRPSTPYWSAWVMVQPLLSNQLSALGNPGRKQVKTQMAESLPTTLETQMEFLVLGLNLAQAQLL